MTARAAAAPEPLLWIGERRCAPWEMVWEPLVGLTKWERDQLLDEGGLLARDLLLALNRYQWRGLRILPAPGRGAIVELWACTALPADALKAAVALARGFLLGLDRARVPGRGVVLA